MMLLCWALIIVIICFTGRVSGSGYEEAIKFPVNSREGVNDYLIAAFKLDKGVRAALIHAILVAYKRGTVTNFDIVACEIVDVPGNGKKYQMYVEIILNVNPCYIDYYEVWESVEPAGWDLTEYHKTSIPCRAKHYANDIINAGYYDTNSDDGMNVYSVIPVAE